MAPFPFDTSLQKNTQRVRRTDSSHKHINITRMHRARSNEHAHTHTRCARAALQQLKVKRKENYEDQTADCHRKNKAQAVRHKL